MPAATARTSKLDHDLHQAQNSGKVNLSLLEILKLLKARHSFKKHSLFFLMHWPYKNANISERGSHILFPSSNEGAVANGHLWKPRATRASWEVGGLGLCVTKEQSWRRKTLARGKEDRQNYQLILCPGQALWERICASVIFPLGTICNYYHSSLIFNSFY